MLVTLSQPKQKTMDNKEVPVEEKVDYDIDGSNYISVIAYNGGHPFTLWFDPDSIDKKEQIGYFNLDGTKTPAVRVTFKDGQVMEVLDKWWVLR